MSATSSLASVVMIANVRNPFARRRFLPVLPNARESERRAVRHGDRVGLLRLLPLDRLPSEETVHRHDAAALAEALANLGRSRSLSYLALLGCARAWDQRTNMESGPQRSGSSDISPVL
jgi:hypothetical protein